MADSDAIELKRTEDARRAATAALQAAIGAEALLRRWLSLDGELLPYDVDTEAVPLSADECVGIEALMRQACMKLGEATSRGGLSPDTREHRGVFDAQMLAEGLAQLLEAAQIADDQQALRPEAGAVVASTVERIKTLISESPLYRADLAEAA